MFLSLLLLILVLLSWGLTRWLRHYALAHNILDRPNQRSSHQTPVPRGGGLAIVISFGLGLVTLYATEQLNSALFIALLGAGLLVAATGAMDDFYQVSRRQRLVMHFMAAIWLLGWLGMPTLAMGDYGAWLVYPVVCMALVWLLNLYNFMDGINGIASIEAISCCLAMALLALLQGHMQQSWLSLTLAASVLGFLFWNFPHARIFMGDVGSGFLGILLGAFMLDALNNSMPMFYAWVILLAVFITDASLTLCVRLIQGQQIYQAHRSHAYQNASRKFASHTKVSLCILAINLLWLLPMASLVVFGLLAGPVAIIIAYLPLLMLALYLRAGKPGVYEMDTSNSGLSSI